MTKTKKLKERVPCKYPMNLFYNYKDEVPEGTRVCTEQDCEHCDFEICGSDSGCKYCLIWDFKK